MAPTLGNNRLHAGNNRPQDGPPRWEIIALHQGVATPASESRIKEPPHTCRAQIPIRGINVEGRVDGSTSADWFHDRTFCSVLAHTVTFRKNVAYEGGTKLSPTPLGSPRPALDSLPMLKSLRYLTETKPTRKSRKQKGKRHHANIARFLLGVRGGWDVYSWPHFVSPFIGRVFPCDTRENLYAWESTNEFPDEFMCFTCGKEQVRRGVPRICGREKGARKSKEWLLLGGGKRAWIPKRLFAAEPFLLHV